MNPSRPRSQTLQLSSALAPLAAAASGAGALGLFVWTGSLWPALGWVVTTLGAAAVAGHRARAADETSELESAVSVIRCLADGDDQAALECEPGPFADAVRALSERQARLTAATDAIASRIEALPRQIGQMRKDMSASGDDIEEAVEETASLLAHINSSIRGINSEVESLSRSTEEASSSILEMGSSVDEVARSAGALHDSVDASTSSIHEISASIRQVAESADAVQGMAEESASAMIQMDRAIQEVSQHVSNASELTVEVSAGADEGSRAVVATIEGIDQIRRQTLEARSVLERLAERIGEIGEIVDVIGSINDETNLLSLNAAIIAAQAGEQGKAFAVVANHVKTLAQRTANSTKEIEALIRAVQDESANAVNAMGAGIESVETGVERSRKAGQALDKIRNSSRDASSRVAEIARATEEQSRNSKHVAEAAQRTSSMVQQITSAMAEQSRASETMMSNAESALELCRQVHRSTEEQRESGRFINASVSAISEMIRSIQGNTESHSAASEAVADAVGRILEVARKGGASSNALAEGLDALLSDAAGWTATHAAPVEAVAEDNSAPGRSPGSFA